MWWVVAAALAAVAAPFVVTSWGGDGRIVNAATTTAGDVSAPGETVSEAASSSEESLPADVRGSVLAERPESKIARRAERTSHRTKARFHIERGTTLKLIPPPPEDFTVRIGSFNVLGSQHTAPGGDRRNFPPASSRTASAVGLVAKHGVDILGTQELQDDQLRQLQAGTGMAAYPGFAWGTKETDNSILWDPGVFELVDGSSFTLTFMSRARPQPIVKLRHIASGREFYVVNTHPSAGGGVYAAQRRAGQGALVSVVRNLKATGLPVFVTGDMNDREAFYCNVVPSAGLTASNGGSYSGGCRPPPGPLPVDWVVGYGASWSNYWRDTTPVDRRVSDHFFISATAYVG